MPTAQAAHFDGADDTAQAADSTALRTPSTAITVAGWTYRLGTGKDYNGLFNKEYAGVDPWTSYYAYEVTWAGDARYVAAIGDGTTDHHNEGGPNNSNITNNVWRFFALTWTSGSGVRFRVWDTTGTIVRDVTSGNVTTTIAYAALPFWLARNGVGEEYHGRFACFGIHNAALTDAQLITDADSWFNTGRPPVALSGPFWPLDGHWNNHRVHGASAANVLTPNGGATFVTHTNTPWTPNDINRYALTSGKDLGNHAGPYLTASITPTANRLVLAAVTMVHNTQDPPAPTLSGCGLTWTLIDGVVYDQAGQRGATYLYRAQGASPTAGQVSVTAQDGAAGNRVGALWVIAEFDNTKVGNGGADAIAQTVKGTTAGDATSLALPTLAAFGDARNLPVSAWGQDDDFDFIPEDGWIEIAEVADSVVADSVAMHFGLTQDTTPTVTWSAGAQAGGVAVELVHKDATVGGPTPTANVAGTVTAVTGTSSLAGAAVTDVVGTVSAVTGAATVDVGQPVSVDAAGTVSAVTGASSVTAETRAVSVEGSVTSVTGASSVTGAATVAAASAISQVTGTSTVTGSAALSASGTVAQVAGTAGLDARANVAAADSVTAVTGASSVAGTSTVSVSGSTTPVTGKATIGDDRRVDAAGDVTGVTGSAAVVGSASASASGAVTPVTGAAPVAASSSASAAGSLSPVTAVASLSGVSVVSAAASVTPVTGAATVDTGSVTIAASGEVNAVTASAGVTVRSDVSVAGVVASVSGASAVSGAARVDASSVVSGVTGLAEVGELAAEIDVSGVVNAVLGAAAVAGASGVTVTGSVSAVTAAAAFQAVAALSPSAARTVVVDAELRMVAVDAEPRVVAVEPS